MKIASISVLHSAASLLAAATAHRHHHHHHHHSDSNFLVATSIPNHRILQGLGDDLSLGFDPMNTAVVIVDPMNDFLHPDGVAWGK